jgi:hypothetical protein
MGLVATTKERIVKHAAMVLSIGLLAATGPACADQHFLITRVADSNTQMPGGGWSESSLLQSFAAPAIDGTVVAFWGCEYSGQACVNGGNQGVWKASDGVLSMVADRATAMPSAGGSSWTWGPPGNERVNFQDLSSPSVDGCQQRK